MYKVLFSFFVFSTSLTFGQTWIAMGSGVNQEVFVVDSFNNDIYAGGYFTTAGGNPANYIAEWNGASWIPLGSGTNWSVLAMVDYNGMLIAGGEFTTAGGNSVNYIAQWNGTSWSALGGGLNNTVNALIVYNGELIASGSFYKADGKNCNSIARWNGTSWDSLGSGLNGETYALAVYNGNLYAAGDATAAGGKTANYIAMWNGTTWSDVGGGLADTLPHATCRVNIMAVYNGNLYVSGNITTAGGVPIGNIAKWNGKAWSSASGYGLSYPESFTVYQGNFYSAGLMNTSSQNYHVAEWNGTYWDTLGAGFSQYTISSQDIWSLCGFNGSLYAGGNFNRIGTGTDNFVAQWAIPLGINELYPSSSAKVYPNPSNGLFTIQSSTINGKPSVEIYNTLGEKVYTAKLNATTTQIDLSNNLDGIYLYRVVTETGNLVSEGKIVIQK